MSSESFLRSERAESFAVAAIAAIAAVPFALATFLPMVDGPMHVLELAVLTRYTDPEFGFAQHYTLAPWTLPYWGAPALGALFTPFLPVERAFACSVAVIVALLPVAAAVLARSLGVRPIFALALVPFVYERNLAFGFVAYALGAVLALFALALVVRFAEFSLARGALALGALSLAVGFTHPHVAGMLVVAVAGYVLSKRDGPRTQRGLALACSSLALVPFAVHAARSPFTYTGADAAWKWDSLASTIRALPIRSIDVFPEPTEEALFGVVGALLALAWWKRDRSAALEPRPWIAAVAALVGYFTLPFEYGGQWIAPRMPYFALLLLPALAPRGPVSARGVRVGLVAVALVGALNTAAHVRQFDLETAAGLEPVIAATPRQPRVFYIAYDVNSPWIGPPVHLHAGAYVVARRGGVYAFNFDRLNIVHRPVAGRERLIGREFASAARFARTRQFVSFDRSAFIGWDTVLTRWPGASEGPAPIVGEGVEAVAVGSGWGLFSIRDAPVSP